jgi:hypothetical protein
MLNNLEQEMQQMMPKQEEGAASVCETEGCTRAGQGGKGVCVVCETFKQGRPRAKIGNTTGDADEGEQWGVCLRQMPSRGEGVEEYEDVLAYGREARGGVGMEAGTKRIVQCSEKDTLATVIGKEYGIDRGRALDT